MSSAGPIIGTLFSLVQGVVYLVVGAVVARRPLQGPALAANRAFVTFWYALGIISFVGAATIGAAALGITDLAFHVTIVHAALFAICLALWGLVYYFAYLFTGSPRWLAPSAAAYGVFYLSLVYLIAWMEPISVTRGDWSVEVEYDREFPQGGPVFVAFILLLLGPPLVGAVAYLSLFFRVKDRIQRYRIGMVAGGIAVWMFTGLVAGLLRLAETTEWWTAASRVISLAASLMVLAAFRPPARLRERLEAPDG